MGAWEQGLREPGGQHWPWQVSRHHSHSEWRGPKFLRVRHMRTAANSSLVWSRELVPGQPGLQRDRGQGEEKRINMNEQDFRWCSVGRVLAQHAWHPGFDTQRHINSTWWSTLVISTLRAFKNWRQEDQEIQGCRCLFIKPVGSSHPKGEGESAEQIKHFCHPDNKSKG